MVRCKMEQALKAGKQQASFEAACSNADLMPACLLFVMWDSSPVGCSDHNAYNRQSPYTGNDRHLAEDCASEFPAHWLPGAEIDVLLLPLETSDRECG